jgi:hypothetical protein
LTFLTKLTLQRLLMLILLALVFGMAANLPQDTDTWWQLHTGKYILQNRIIPMTDPFSMTRLGQAWLDPAWGTQIIIASVYNLFGGGASLPASGSVGLMVYTALFAALGMFFIYQASEGNAYVKAFVIILASATANIFWSARPQMITFAMSALVLYLLSRHRHGKKGLWILPILTILWVNMHGGFSVGFIILGCAIVGEGLNIFWTPNEEASQLNSNRSLSLRTLVIVTVVSFAVVVINPYTTQLWTYAFSAVASQTVVLQQFLQEWASPNFHTKETWPFLLLLLGTLVAFRLSKLPPDWTQILQVSGFALLSLYSGRNISIFALVVAPALIQHIDAILKDKKWLRENSRRASVGSPLINWVLLIFIVIGVAAKVWITAEPKNALRVQSETFPIKAVAYLNEHKPDGPMFNSYNWGGYIMFAAPDYKTFVDGRTDLYGDQLLTEWLDAISARNWEQIFQKWNIKLAFIESVSPLAGVLRYDTRWKALYQDDQASIFQLVAR